MGYVDNVSCFLEKGAVLSPGLAGIANKNTDGQPPDRRFVVESANERRSGQTKEESP